MKRRYRRKAAGGLFGTDVLIEYRGHDSDKDSAIRAILEHRSTGSGYCFPSRSVRGVALFDHRRLPNQGVRDHTAIIPHKEFAQIIRKLKKIRGLTIKKLVQKWVRVR